MIVITGAAGFIGSRMVRHLNESGRDDLILVDDFSLTDRRDNWEGVRYMDKLPRDLFFDWASQNLSHIDFLIHLGAETMVQSTEEDLVREYNLEFSQRLWSLAAMHRIPLLYAASSIDNNWYWTENVMVGENHIIPNLPEQIPGKEIGLCERMKRQFDNWVMKQRVTPPLWAGFSMVEVYGPGEAHKGPLASSVWQLYQQFCLKGYMSIPYEGELYNVNNELFKDRIFVKDVVTVFTWFINHLPASGFYRLDTGYERPLSAVAKAIFLALKKEPKMEFVSFPSISNRSVRQENQLPLNSLRSVGYKKSFTPLEKGVRIYMRKQHGYSRGGVNYCIDNQCFDKN